MDDFHKAFDIFRSFDDYQNRTTYTSLDVKTLGEIPDDKLEEVIVEYVIRKLNAASDDAAVLESLSKGNRALWLTWDVVAEVNNGGLNQYYLNSSGRNSSEAPAAFEFFAATEHADLMREANVVRKREAAAIAALFKENENKNCTAAFSASYEVSKLGPLDDRFFKLSEDLSALCIAKIRQAPELFVGD